MKILKDDPALLYVMQCLSKTKYYNACRVIVPSTHAIHPAHSAQVQPGRAQYQPGCGAGHMCWGDFLSGVRKINLLI